MRRLPAFPIVLLPLVFSAACGPSVGGTRRPRLAADELPVTRAVLYQNGIGYFERRGRIAGDHFTIRIRPDQIADFLKSITVVDLSKGGRAVSVALPVEKSQSRQLADLPPQVREQGGVLAVAAAFRGARATVSGRDGTATGRIVGVEQIEIPGKGPDVPPAREWRLTLLVDGETLRTFRLAEVRSLKILDKSLSVGLAKALDATLNEASWKPIELTIELAGRSPHDIAVSYVVEMPTWKPAYRVVVADAGQALLQGWAVVDNVSGEDWYDVMLSLTAGTPLAFVYDLYTPHYVRRPDLSPPQEEYGYAPPADAYVGGGMGGPGGSPPPPPAAARPYDESAADGDAAGARMRGEEGKMGKRDSARRSGQYAMKSSPAEPELGRRQVTDDDLERNYRTLVAGAGVSSLFRYDLSEPVSVKDRQSALVSIVSTKVPGEDVLVFRVGLDGQNPYRSVRLKNDTGFVLERGPVAIYREATFLGEALTARMEKGATVFVPYALDTRVDLFLAEERRDEGMRLVTIVNGRLIAESKAVTRFTYEVDNRSGEKATLYVQRPRRTGWTITRVALADDRDRAAPPQAGKEGVIEEKNVYYVPINLPEAGKVKIVVEEETPARRDVEILSAQGREIILAYAASPDADPAVARALKEAGDISDRLAAIDRRLADLQEQRQMFEEREAGLRENLNLLRKSKTNDALRRELETRLAEIVKLLDANTAEYVKLSEERARLTERLTVILKGITLKK